MQVEDGSGFAGIPDAFARLWTPHRMAYIDGAGKPTDESIAQCPFCSVPQLTDEAGLIVHRGVTCYVVLNLYPYAAGHVLVCPYRHTAFYVDLTPAETIEMAELTQTAIRVLQQVAHPEGFNLGMNQGRIGGAGIAAHAHQHVVPRWAGDANFMPIIGQTRPMPQLLGATRQLLAQAWPGEAD